MCNIREIITWETGVIAKDSAVKGINTSLLAKERGKVTKISIPLDTKYKSLSEQHFANLRYVATYKNRTDFSKTVILTKSYFHNKWL